jgi:O-antigen/teichoic acid export membrane protein
VATGLERAVALGIALYLPRHLDLADYGRYAFVLSYLNLFQALPDAGLEAVLVVRLANAGAATAEVAGRGALVRLVTSLVGAGTGIALLALVGSDTTVVRAAGVWAVALLATAATPYRALLRARLAMGRYLALMAAQGGVALILLGFVVRAGGGLIEVMAAVGAANLSGLVLGRLLGGAGARFRVDAGLGRALAAAAWPLVGSTLALVAAQQVLQIVLMREHGAAEMGLLGGAQKLTDAVNLLPSALMVSVLPALAVHIAAPGGAAAGAARDAARLLAVVIVPLAGGLAIWAEPLLATIFGARFVAAAPALRVLAGVTVLVATGTVVTNLLLAAGRQRWLLVVTAGSAVVMAGAGAVLVRAYGAPGAAAAMAGGMLVGQAALAVLPATRSQVNAVLAAVVRPVALGGVAIVIAGRLGVVPALALLLLGYPLALYLTGTVTRADLARWRA